MTSDGSVGVVGLARRDPVGRGRGTRRRRQRGGPGPTHARDPGRACPRRQHRCQASDGARGSRRRSCSASASCAGAEAAGTGRSSSGLRRTARRSCCGACAPFEIVFLLAGLGGGTGSALLPFLSRELRGTETLADPGRLPPVPRRTRDELGPSGERRGDGGDLEAMGGLLVALANEKLRRFESLPIHRVFQVRNAYLHSLVASLVDMVENPSQISVDLASLKNHSASSGLSTLIVGEYHISEPERLVHQALSESLLDYHLSARAIGPAPPGRRLEHDPRHARPGAGVGASAARRTRPARSSAPGCAPNPGRSFGSRRSSGASSPGRSATRSHPAEGPGPAGGPLTDRPCLGPRPTAVELGVDQVDDL